MKIFIIGMNAVGKAEVLKDLSTLGIQSGKRFCTVSEVTNEYYLPGYHIYDNEEVNKMFENKAYFFLHENTDYSLPFYEGLSLYEYENYDVFVLTLDQFVNVPKFDKDTVFIWMDSNVQSRRSRYISERRKYDFVRSDNAEHDNVVDFVDKLYNYKNVLYFNNEDPQRVSAIIYALMNNPKLIDIFKNRFN